MNKITAEVIKEELKNVLDPELNVNIVDLGLIYDIQITDDNVVKIKMTLTTPACPLGPQVMQDVRNALTVLEGVKDVVIDFVWEPAWTPERMSEEAREQLKIDQ